MDKLIVSLIEQGGPVGVVVAVVVLLVIVGAFLRQKGIIAFGDQTKVVRRDELGAINHKLKNVDQSLRGLDRRVQHVETDLQSRPTVKQVHDLEKSFVRMEGKFEAVETDIRATRAAVTRIEEHMYRMAEAAVSEGT